MQGSQITPNLKRLIIVNGQKRENVSEKTNVGRLLLRVVEANSQK